jgi:hypothetical protein
MRAELAGFQLDGPRGRPSEESLAARGDPPDACDQHRLCVSDRMMAVLRDHRPDRCEIEPLSD